MMSENNSIPNSENHVILPAAPGSNPSSFPPGVIFPVEPTNPVQPSIDLPGRDGGDFSGVPDRQGGDYIDLPDGGHVAPNGAVIHDPCSDIPEVRPDNEYTPDKEDLNLLIM